MFYNSVDTAQSFKLRGTYQGTNDGLLFTPPSLSQRAVGGTPQSRSTALLEGLALGYVSLHNRSGSTIAMGFGVRLPNRLWIAGQWDDSEATAFTDDTTDAQDAGASDFALETANVASDGFVIASSVKFNALSINPGTSSAGGVVRVARYTNLAGDGWTNFSNLYQHDAATANYTAGSESVLVFPDQVDWGVTQSGGLSGIPAGYYAVNVRATTPPTTAGLATALEVLKLYMLNEGVADNGTLERPEAVPLRMPSGDGLVAFFGTASDGNRVLAQVRVQS